MRAAPALFALLTLALWEGAVRAAGLPPYILPTPSAIVGAFTAAPGLLLASLASTLLVTAVALVASVALGVGLALLMQASPLARAAVLPWAVGAAGHAHRRNRPADHRVGREPVHLAGGVRTIVAFFPVFSNTATGLAATPQPLLDLFRLNGATRWQTLRLLRLPAALPLFLAGLRVSGGLALVGAVVAEFVAGSGGVASGLAYRILEAGYRLQIPRMFAALALLSAAGIAINAGLGWLERRLLGTRPA